MNRKVQFMNNHNALVVNYPNQIGDCGRYELRDQRSYFSKFEDGASFIFELALFHILSDELDVTTFAADCGLIFDQHYHQRFAENSTSLPAYHADQREFNRRIFDIYRFAKSTLGVLGKNHGLSAVKRIATNRSFDSGSFLLKWHH